jgi:hypothetical protein
MHGETRLTMILEGLAVFNGFLLGALIVGLVVFETKVLPRGHFLLLPLFIIGATIGALANTYAEPPYLIYVTLAETLANIGLGIWTVREERIQKK